MLEVGGLFEAFRKELFRWNRQINLVSRQETEDRLDGLFKQCSGGGYALVKELESMSSPGAMGVPVYYFDLGSGGGLPGIIWHVLFSHKAPSVISSVKTWLVEPREKRAWFLDRLNRIVNMPSFGVLHGRWGDVVVDGSGFPEDDDSSPVVVVSLKALHLDDIEVCEGLNAAFSGFCSPFSLVIARYYPPDQAFDSKLVKSLKMIEGGQSRELGGCTYSGAGGGVSSLTGDGVGLASLVISKYLVNQNS